MSRENVEVAQRVLAAIARHDRPYLTEAADPEVEWHTLIAGLGKAGIYHGHEGMRQWLADIDDAFGDTHAEVDEAIGVGEIVVLVGRLHYRGRASGAESDSAVGWMMRFRRGKLIRLRVFRDPEDALEAVGLRE
jgi:ketosteroid isomerase-like protein